MHPRKAKQYYTPILLCDKVADASTMSCTQEHDRLCHGRARSRGELCSCLRTHICFSRVRGPAIVRRTAESRMGSISQHHELVKYADYRHRLVTLLMVKQQQLPFFSSLFQYIGGSYISWIRNNLDDSRHHQLLAYQLYGASGTIRDSSTMRQYIKLISNSALMFELLQITFPSATQEQFLISMAMADTWRRPAGMMPSQLPMPGTWSMLGNLNMV